MLHSRLLRYIDEIARCGSIRAAGERLHVAPSAINKHLLLLEEELGGPLFERLPRGMRPTPTGELLLGHLRKTMLEYRQVEAEIRDLKTLQRGEVIIATMAGLASGIISTAALNFCAANESFDPDHVQERHGGSSCERRCRSWLRLQPATVIPAEMSLGYGHQSRCRDFNEACIGANGVHIPWAMYILPTHLRGPVHVNSSYRRKHLRRCRTHRRAGL